MLFSFSKQKRGERGDHHTIVIIMSHQELIDAVLRVLFLKACGDGDEGTAQAYLEFAGADLHATNSNGETALHLACRGGHVETVRMIFFEGAKLAAMNGWPPYEQPFEEFQIVDSYDLRTRYQKGSIDGQGQQWFDTPRSCFE